MAAEPEHSVHIKSLELERLVFFSDAVFAIAITLLVLELRAPARSSSDPQLLANGLIQMIPRFVSFLMSFWLVGLYWFLHHRVFRHIRRWDEGLIWLNLHLLFWVAFLPFPMSVMGTFGDQRLAVVLYGASLAMMGWAHWLLWRHASRGRRLLDPDFDSLQIRRITMRSAVPPLVALCVVVLAWILPRPGLASFAFVLIWPLQQVFQSRVRSKVGPGHPRSAAL